MKTFLLLTLLSITAGKFLVEEYFDALEKYQPDGNLLMSGADGDKMQRQRFHNFKQYKEEVDRINGDDSIPFTATVNQFSVLTEEERKAYTGLNVSMFSGDENELSAEPELLQSNFLPSYIDWVSRGAQPPIKNQGICASCWAFAGISAIDNIYYLTTGDRVSFSEQEILDCGYENTRKNGCTGGWLNAPVDYVKRSRRLASNRDNRYRGRDSTCSYSRTPNSLTKATITGYRTYRGDRNLMSAVSRSVVSVAIKVANSFHVYSSGVYQDVAGCRGQSVDHAVSVVGYGQSNGRSYWRVRNSWGNTWGDKGYIRMSRDVTNNCMISDYVYQTVMKCSGRNCSPPKFDEQEQEKYDDNNSDNNSGDTCENVRPDSYCNKYTMYCKQGSKYYDFMSKQCQKACGMCKESDNGGMCPPGTVRCSDGVCKHEHMCS